MNHNRWHMFPAFVLIAALLIVFTASAAWSQTPTYVESYSSDEFKTGKDWLAIGTETVLFMDAAYFEKRPIIFFNGAFDKSGGDGHIYLSTPEFSGDKPVVDIPWMGRDSETRIKTAVFNSVLYLFYAPTWSTSKIQGDTFYRTITVDHGITGDEWTPMAGNEHKLSTGLVNIQFATVMNGRLYIVYTSGANWYYMRSDGFADDGTIQPALFHTSATAVGDASGTVFYVPDENDPNKEGYREVLMVANTSTADASLHYFFFDGEKPVYGESTLSVAAGAPTSVRLFTGTATNYTSSHFAVQAFITIKHSDDYSFIYHKEYVPAGADGNTGSWSPSWGQLNASNDDAVRSPHFYGCIVTVCVAEYTGPQWAIIPNFSTNSTDKNIYSTMDIWGYRDMVYNAAAAGRKAHFRRLRFTSDVLAYDDNKASSSSQDLSTGGVPLGVIQGTPPFPVNNGIPTTDSAGTSIVELTTYNSVTFTTTWTATIGASLSYGTKFGPVGVQGKVTGGVKYANETAKQNTVTYTDTLQNYNYPGAPGDLGWVLYLKPDLKINQYIVRSWKNTALSYPDKTETDQLRITSIAYGPDSVLEKKAFYLHDPSFPMGGNDTSTAIFKGMQRFPLTTDTPLPTADYAYSWQTPVTETDSYSITKALPALSSSQGDKAKVTYVETTTDATTKGFNAGYSISVNAFGAGFENNANFSMDSKTTSVMQYGMGFSYAVPPCGSITSEKCCISDMSVYPFVVTPVETDAGYLAPWISDDIRLYRKAKPWSLTWSVVPSRQCPRVPAGAAGPGATRITLEKAEGVVFLDDTGSYRDRLTAEITLTGIAPGFTLSRDEWFNLGLGNHITDPHRLQVISTQLHGDTLFLELKGEGPDSLIRVKLTYNSGRSRLDIKVDADHVDLTNLYAYRVVEDGGRGTAPAHVYLAEKYFAKGDLDVQCKLNHKFTVCDFYAKRN